MDEEFDIGYILGTVRRGLATASSFSYSEFAEIALAELDARGKINLPKSRQSTPSGIAQAFLQTNTRLEAAITASYFYLFHQGYAASQSNWPNTPTLNRLHLTDRGRDWLKSGDTAPEDAQTYMKTLKQSVPNLDTVIEQYVLEALVTFNKQAWFASAVMLGAAAEKAIYLLADALQNAVKDEGQKKFLANRIKDRQMPRLFDAVQEYLKKFDIPYETHEGATTHLISFFEAIRIQRNDAVHPAVGHVTPNRVRILLASFPQALSVISGLTDWLNTSPG